MSDSNPYTASNSARVKRTIEDDVISCLNDHPRILLHGPRRSGKTDVLGAIQERASSSAGNPETKLLLFRIIGPDCLDPPLKDCAKPEEQHLVLFDDLDNVGDNANAARTALLNQFSGAKVVATAQGRYWPRGGLWEDWHVVPIGLFSRGELEELINIQGGIISLASADDHHNEITDGIWYLSNGHPFLARKACEFLYERWNEFKSKDIWTPQSFEKLICTCHGRDKDDLVNQIHQYLFGLSTEAKMLLTLIAIASGYMVDPGDQGASSSSENRGRTRKAISGIRNFFGRLPRVFVRGRPQSLSSPDCAGRKEPQPPLTTDALMVTHDAQEWLSGPYPVLGLLDALDNLEDEETVIYDLTQGWQITPMVAVYYRRTGWAAINDLELTHDFRRWGSGV